MNFDLNNRELAVAVWLAVFVIAMSFFKGNREAFGGVLKSLFAWKIMQWFLAMSLYIGLFTYLFHRLGLWTPDLLKDTVFYVLFSASVTFFKINKAKSNGLFFRELLLENLKLGIFMEFLTGLYPFALWEELIIVPVGAFLAAMQVFAAKDPAHQAVNRLINRIWQLAGAVIIFHIAKAVFQHFQELLSLDNLRQILLAPNLTLVFIPFLYVLSLRMIYEEEFILLSFKLRDKALFNFAKRQAMLKFNTDLGSLKRWVSRWNLSKPQTRKAVLATIADLKEQQQIEKHPPIIQPSEGWSPYQAKAFLADHSLVCGFYDPGFEEQWNAKSTPFKLPKDWSGNQITYKVSGSKFIAERLELLLTVYTPDKAAPLLPIYSECVAHLYHVATGVTMTTPLISAVIKNKTIKYEQGRYIARLHKEKWGNNIDSYDLSFSLAINQPLHSNH